MRQNDRGGKLLISIQKLGSDRFEFSGGLFTLRVNRSWCENLHCYIAVRVSSKRQDTQRRRRKLHEELRGLSFQPLMRGSIVDRMRRCGRAGCACASDPAARHSGKYLSVNLDGRTVAIHLRAEDEERVRRAIEAYRRLWEVINGLTGCEVADLRREARERVRGRKRGGGGAG